MSIDIDHEELLSPAQASAYLRRLTGRKKIGTRQLYRWISHGVGGVRLEVVRIGGLLFTSKQALQRFAARGTCQRSATPRVRV